MFRQKGFVVPTDMFLKIKFFVNTTFCLLLFSSRRFERTYFFCFQDLLSFLVLHKQRKIVTSQKNIYLNVKFKLPERGLKFFFNIVVKFLGLECFFDV